MTKGSKKTKRTKDRESFFEELTGQAGTSSGWSTAMAVDDQPSASGEAAAAGTRQQQKKGKAAGAVSMETDKLPLKGSKMKKRGQLNHLRVQVGKTVKVNARGNKTAAQKLRRQKGLEKALERSDKISSRLGQMQGVKVRKLSLKKMY